MNIILGLFSVDDFPLCKDGLLFTEGSFPRLPLFAGVSSTSWRVQHWKHKNMVISNSYFLQYMYIVLTNDSEFSCGCFLCLPLRLCLLLPAVGLSSKSAMVSEYSVPSDDAKAYPQKITNITTTSCLEKDVFLSYHECGTKKNSEPPWGIKPQTFGFCTLILYHWATETPWWVRSITKFIWHVLHTARISNVDSIMFVDRNKRDGRFFGASCLQALLANIACNIALKLSNQLVTWLNASWCISWQPANSRRIVGPLFENNWPMMVNQLWINTQPTMLALISTLLELQSTFSLLLADYTLIHRSGFEWLN